MDYKFTIDSWGNKVTVIPRLALYTVEDFMGKQLPGLAIILDMEENGYLEQYATLSVSFGEYISMKDVAYIDTNNCPFANQIFDQLEEKELVIDTGFTKRSGFCEYPLWKFKPEFLSAIGESNYKQYSDEHDQYEAALEKMFCEE